MSAYRETDKASKDNKETNEVKGFMQTHKPNKGEEGKDTNTGNRREVINTEE